MAITLQASETSNRDWIYQFEVSDEETGDLIDFTGAYIAMSITDADGCQKVSATTTNGKITIIGTGVIQLTLRYADTNLCAGSYNIGGFYQLNGDTLDLLDGSIAVRKGIPAP